MANDLDPFRLVFVNLFFTECLLFGQYDHEEEGRHPVIDWIWSQMDTILYLLDHVERMMKEKMDDVLLSLSLSLTTQKRERETFPLLPAFVPAYTS